MEETCQCPRAVSRGVPSIREGLFSHSLEGVCPDQAAALRPSTKGLNYIAELIMPRGLAKLEHGQRLAQGESTLGLSILEQSHLCSKWKRSEYWGRGQTCTRESNLPLLFNNKGGWLSDG